MRESRAVHRPSLPSTTLQTIPCVWSCGSSSREAGWTKQATASPAGTCPSRPPNPRRARPPSSSRNEKAALTAPRCASASAARSGSSASAQASDTDFGAESVKSQPGVWSVATAFQQPTPVGVLAFREGAERRRVDRTDKPQRRGGLSEPVALRAAPGVGDVVLDALRPELVRAQHGRPQRRRSSTWPRSPRSTSAVGEALLAPCPERSSTPPGWALIPRATCRRQLRDHR